MLISDKGEFIKCKDDYILLASNNFQSEGIRICKSLNSQDFRNCDNINIENGKCTKWKEDYYLNELDKKCCQQKIVKS